MRRLGQAAIGRREPEPQPCTLFEAHDEVERVHTVTDKESGRPKDFAFVEMAATREADNACLGPGGRELEGARCASMKPRQNRTNAREFRLPER